MALQLVLESFDNLDVNGQNWRFRPGDLIEDGVAPIAGGPIVPVLALRAQGLAYIPYVAGTMAVMLAAYLADHGLDDNPPSMIPWLVEYAVALSALTPLTGIVDPSGVVTGLFGQTYRDTVLNIWHICTSNPTGTAWAPMADYDQLASIVGAAEGAARIGTDPKLNLGGGNTVEACLEFLDDGQYDPGCVASFQIIQAGLPVAAETLTIGADIYEADGAGANINFAIVPANPNATFVNLFNAIVANGTENLVADQLDATHIRLRSAVAPNGAVVAADPNIVLAEAMTNYTFDCGAVNVNTLAGRAAGQRRIAGAVLTLNAGHLAAGQVRISFPAPVIEAIVTYWTTTNVAHAIGTDSWAIDNGDILVTLPGGGAPQLVAGDIVRVLASC